MPTGKRTGIGPRRKTRSTTATQAVAVEAAAVVREKKAVTQAAKAAISQQRNQILKKINMFLEEMELSQLQKVLLAVASTSFANSPDYRES